MENLVLFWITVAVYFVVWNIYQEEWDVRPELRKYMARLLTVALLCMPFNINGNMWTVFGNAVSEKSVYSLWSMYQDAGEDAVSVLGLPTLYQRADRETVMVFGVAGYQQAGRDAVVVAGVAGYQNAEKKARILFGVAGYEKAMKTTGAMFDVTFYTNEDDVVRTFHAFDFRGPEHDDE